MVKCAIQHWWVKAVLSLGLLSVVCLQFSLRIENDLGNLLELSKQEFLAQTDGGNVGNRPPNITAVSKDAPEYHVVFSTSCTDQQHWESMVFFYHCLKVKQPGTVTRIASGCTEEESQALVEFHKKHIETMSSQFRLHLTPDFSRVRLARGKSPYKYMNKPYGLRHWMENSLGMKEGGVNDPRLEDGVVILMDPDMILLRPLLHDFTSENVIWAADAGAVLTKVVRHGFPMAQQDGYLRNDWRNLNWTYIMDKPVEEYRAIPPPSDGPKYWQTGPPYLATVKDMFNIVTKWTELAPRVLDVFPELFAEMYGFIIATVQLNLPFTLIRSVVVSTTATYDREGWPYVDSLADDEICHPPPTAPLPIGLHYCKRYLSGVWFFSKYRMKKNIMDCDKDLLRPPPHDLVGKYDFAVLPPKADWKPGTEYKEERKNFPARQMKREVFMLCALASAINEALSYHKIQKCESPNLNENYTVHDDPSNY